MSSRFIFPLFPENFVNAIARSHRQKLLRSGEEKYHSNGETNVGRTSFVKLPSLKPLNGAQVTYHMSTASLDLESNPPTNIDWLKALVKFATKRNASILE